ncbi:MAG: hypothetical protein J0L82_03005 [Deltaproteobacteria bacterium]|jgi:hypothetical protein|nr:hypothetical protein [Deltaproteobacteria bacterium]
MARKTTLDPLASQRGGLAGAFETLMRRFKTLLHIALIVPLYLVGCAIIGLAVAPGVLLVALASRLNQPIDGALGLFLQAWLVGAAIVAAIFLSGFLLVLILPLTNFVLLWGGKLKPWRGPYYSLEAIRWYIHNGITYVLRYTLLEFFTPSPIAVLFYRLMGMKIGRGTVINSTALSDPSLVSIGEKVTIGGSVTIVAHYGQAGFLILAPVVIGDGATIGLRASIMGGAKIGSNARVMAHSVVLPKAEIPEGEIWGGVPAVKLESAKEDRAAR